MYFHFKKNLLLLFTFLTLLVFPVAVFALETIYPDIMGMSLTSNSELTDYVKYFVNIAIGSAGILATASMVIGGIFYLISRGIGKYTGMGLEWVKSGLLGMVLLICAYLILYTINPALISPMLQKLIPIPGFMINQNIEKQGLPVISYQEIPLGKLTETVLSKEINCYDFDDSGDPIQNKTKTDSGEEVDGPTFLVHDRADCLAKLNFALEKKSVIIANLSKKIVELMNNCGCANSSGCETPTGVKCPSLPAGDWLVGQKCSEPLGCQCKTPSTCALPSTEYTMCPAGTKQKIEHGPIQLDPLKNISLNVTFSSPKKSIPNTFSTFACSPDALGNKKYKGLDEFRTKITDPSIYIEKQININNKTVAIINQQNWDNLKLIEQIMYLKDKIKQISDDVQKDLNNLETSKNTLSSSSCYLAKPYVELLKTVEQTNNKEKLILIEKTYDQYTGSPVDVSKYCSGYNYLNSDCQTSCENICPVSSLQNAQAYKTCRVCSLNSPPSCLQEQKTCMTQKINSRKCNPNSQGFNTFNDCMSSCKNKCSDNCSAKYVNCNSSTSNACDSCKAEARNTITPQIRCDDREMYFCTTSYKKCLGACPLGSQNWTCTTSCSNIFRVCEAGACVKDQISELKCQTTNEIVNCDQFKACQDNCNTNSQCLLENQDKCLYNYSAIKNCADKNPEQDGLKNCIDNSLLCRLGSEQNAGYTDCLSKARALEGKSFSSSDLYRKNYSYQKCHDFFSSSLGTFADGASYCKYPETAKCPTSSDCPQCPCGTIIQPPDTTSDSYASLDKNDYRVTSGECGEYVYNDDPLTFYCKKDYWNDPTEKSDKPVGTERVCTKNNEIPIGQTVDNTMLWGQNFANEINNLLSATNEYIGRLQEIGQEKGYCECGSTCGAGESTCNADCTVVEIPNEDGEIIKSCMKGSCSGNPCLKMINLLLGKSSTASCPKGVEIKGLEWYQKQLLFFYNKISDFVIKSRTDIVKQLTFSREKTNQCSVVSKAYDATKETKMINCTRVIDEIISPISEGKIIINSKEINYPCYGKTLGDIIGSGYNYSTDYSNPSENIIPQTDNWFCCEQYIKVEKK